MIIRRPDRGLDPCGSAEGMFVCSAYIKERTCVLARGFMRKGIGEVCSAQRSRFATWKLVQRSLMLSMLSSIRACPDANEAHTWIVNVCRGSSQSLCSCLTRACRLPFLLYNRLYHCLPHVSRHRRPEWFMKLNLNWDAVVAVTGDGMHLVLSDSSFNLPLPAIPLPGAFFLQPVSPYLPFFVSCLSHCFLTALHPLHFSTSPSCV